MPQEQHWLLLEEKFCGKGANQLHGFECLKAGSKSPQEFWPVHELQKWMSLR